MATKKTPTQNPVSFRDAYATLQTHAETLRAQREPDLDNLLDIVTESVEAYKLCKARIDAVESALGEILNKTLSPTPLP